MLCINYYSEHNRSKGDWKSWKICGRREGERETWFARDSSWNGNDITALQTLIQLLVSLVTLNL